MNSTGRIVWMDLEMTGLDPERERIIEVATIITDGDLNVIEEGPAFAVHQAESVLAAMDDWNTRHHNASGLVERVRESDIDDAEAERITLEFVQKHVGPREAPLCGNSIHQDRRFIRRYMPLLDEYLHYRMIDVSSIKELAKRWYPDVHSAIPPKNNVHRALDDIHESIEELRFYREHVFR